MKISGKERLLFDYMQEQANNLFDYCERNGIAVSYPGFFINPDTGYAYVSADAKDEGNTVILSRSKSHYVHGGEWDSGIKTTVLGGGKNE